MAKRRKNFAAFVKNQAQRIDKADKNAVLKGMAIVRKSIQKKVMKLFKKKKKKDFDKFIKQKDSIFRNISSLSVELEKIQKTLAARKRGKKELSTAQHNRIEKKLFSIERQINNYRKRLTKVLINNGSDMPFERTGGKGKLARTFYVHNKDTTLILGQRWKASKKVDIGKSLLLFYGTRISQLNTILSALNIRKISIGHTGIKMKETVGSPIFALNKRYGMIAKVEELFRKEVAGAVDKARRMSKYLTGAKKSK